MGLDMFLYVSVYKSRIDWAKGFLGDDEKFAEDESFRQIVKLAGVEDLLEEEGTTGLQVLVPVFYWRKDNAIHNFFCQLDGGKDECQQIYVHGKELRRLRELCKLELENKDKPDVSPPGEHLPPRSGFFFGSTDFDEWYYSALERTIAMIDKLEESSELDMYTFIYQASW